MVHHRDGENADESGQDVEHHGTVSIAHGRLGRRRAIGEEAAQHVVHIEVCVLHARIGAQADVDQHQANARRDAQTNRLRDRIDDLFADVEQGQDGKENAGDQDDGKARAVSILEGIVHAARSGHCSRNARNHGRKVAVQAHTGGHGKGLVGKERHQQRADAGGNDGGQEDAVPESAAHLSVRAEADDQVGVERNDIRHGHEGRKTREDFGTNCRTILLELEEFFHFYFSPPLFLKPA